MDDSIYHAPARRTPIDPTRASRRRQKPPPSKDHRALPLGMYGIHIGYTRDDWQFYGLMSVIIDFDRANPPLIWTEIAQYVQILRSGDGKGFTSRHRNIKEVMFNIGQDVQSIIAGFVSEARKTSYKAAVKAGNDISPLIFSMAQNQANELRSRFTLTVLAASAGTYKDVSVIYKLFMPEPTKDEKDKKKREAGQDAYSNSSSSARNRPFATTGGGNHNSGSSPQPTNRVTPNGSPTAAASLPGKLSSFIHRRHHKVTPPGCNFPHPTRANQFTILCCRSAFEGRSCTIPTCAFYHFPNQLTQVPRDLKDKLKEWVSNHNLVSWHADAANWANPPDTTNIIQSQTTEPFADERAAQKDCPLTTMLRSDAGGKPPIHQNVTKIGPDPSSTGPNTMPHSDRSAVTNTASEDTVPVTSEYLQTMTPTLDSTGIVNEAMCLTNLSDNWTQGKLTSKRLDTFAKVALPSTVQIQLAQPFGKDSSLIPFTRKNVFVMSCYLF
ncbi:hypothetical protein MHU86_18257 [Fragilaria crotonensis]|nr:hypothetical protein MHU86_18257 [Fragilaria crotonensis]